MRVGWECELLLCSSLAELGFGVAQNVGDGALARIRVDHEPSRVLGNVSRSGHQGVVERGQQTFDAYEYTPCFELFDESSRCLGWERDFVGVRAQASAHIAGARRDRLAHRVQDHAVDLAQRALRLSVEGAQ